MIPLTCKYTKTTIYFNCKWKLHSNSAIILLPKLSIILTVIPENILHGKGHDYTCVKYSKVKELDMRISETQKQNIQLSDQMMTCTDEAIKNLKHIWPIPDCCMHATMLHPSTEYLMSDCFDVEQTARKDIPSNSYVNIQTRQKGHKNGELKLMKSSCLECTGRRKVTKSFELFDEFGAQPECISKFQN